mmetsp:Transcript_23992/g.60370  ORF Transcript_23992/g.60370 Transcript_23992/m.60370 type:complete len:106 (+) Transcript_23992:2850-3167(+)
MDGGSNDTNASPFNAHVPVVLQQPEILVATEHYHEYTQHSTLLWEANLLVHVLLVLADCFDTRSERVPTGGCFDSSPHSQSPELPGARSNLSALGRRNERSPMCA